MNIDWQSLFQNISNLAPQIANFAQGTIGPGMMGAGFGNALKGQQQEYDAWRRRYDDERRLMEEANQARHSQFMAKKGLRDDEIARQAGIQQQSKALFDQSLQRQRSMAPEIEARMKDTLAQYADIPAAPIPKTQGATEAPKVVAENLNKQMADQAARNQSRSQARAQVLAPGFALANTGLQAGDISNALQSTAAQSQRSGRVADIEQQMFNPVPLYPTSETGIDPQADINKLVGSTMFNLGNQIRPSFGDMFGSMFPSSNTRQPTPRPWNSVYGNTYNTRPR